MAYKITKAKVSKSCVTKSGLVYEEEHEGEATRQSGGAGSPPNNVSRNNRRYFGECFSIPYTPWHPEKGDRFIFFQVRLPFAGIWILAPD